MKKEDRINSYIKKIGEKISSAMGVILRLDSADRKTAFSASIAAAIMLIQPYYDMYELEEHKEKLMISIKEKLDKPKGEINV